MQNKDFSLVLSGGGALGIAQIGVIKDMEDKGIIPSEIIGTSMGGIVGACLSIGLSAREITNLFERFSNIFNWARYSYSSNAMIKSSKIGHIFTGTFGLRKMKDTKIPLKLIATDLKTGNGKAFDYNDDVFITDVLLATMAIPGVFQEKIINDKIYVDGFLYENLGITFASKDSILAIDVLGLNSYNPELPTDKIFKTMKVLDMVEKSMRLLIYNQTRRNLELLKDSNKEIKLIDISTKDYKTFQFHKYKDLIKLGQNELDKII